MGNYSEDSIHASVIFSSFPTKRTTQTLRAKAYTAVPQNWRVFLSQRKRWSLGSVSNEFVMIFRPGIILVERLQSIITVITWWCMPFILAAVIALVMLLVRQGREVVKDKVMMGLSAVLLLRYVRPLTLITRTRLGLIHLTGLLVLSGLLAPQELEGARTVCGRVLYAHGCEPVCEFCHHSVFYGSQRRF